MAATSRSSRLKSTLIVAAAVTGLVFCAYAAWHTARVLSVASAFFAKTLCSSLFVAGRNEEEAIREDILADMSFGLRHWRADVDRDRGLVSAGLFGLAKRAALYRPGLGCTLVTGTTPETLLKQASDYTPPRPAQNRSEAWPAGSRVEPPGAPAGFDRNKLDAAVDEAFTEPRPERALRRTHAVVVVHKGRIVAERYARGFGPGTPIPGWSMGKAVLSALIGLLIRDNLLALDQNELFPEWSSAGDPRQQITIEDLLRMVSGLDFDEPHARMLSDVRTMIFLVGDSAAYARSEQLVHPVGSTWFYTIASTSLLASAMRNALGGSQAQYFSYPWKALFEPLGMTTAVMEPDAAGTFLPPAFIYASARDWARFGLFYLNDGVWHGMRLLPEGWVRMQRTPTPQSGGQYGAHLWLRIPDFLRPAYTDKYTLPEDAFFMLGQDGQLVAMFPSQDLVVVRLGLTRRRNTWDHEAFLSGILAAFDRPAAEPKSRL